MVGRLMSSVWLVPAAGDDILLHHRAAKVVNAIFEADLSDFGALCHPRGLETWNIVQEETRDGNGAQVVVAGGFLPVPAGIVRGQVGVVGLEIPRNESGQAAGVVLEVPDVFQVFEALIDGFDVAVHHGGGGVHAQFMGGSMDRQPLVHPVLAETDNIANLVRKNLGAGAGMESRPASRRRRMQSGMDRREMCAI